MGRTVEAIDTFIERLEATTRFENVQPSSEMVTEDGLFQTQVTGRYLTAPPPAQAAPPAGPAAAIVARPAGGAMMDLSRAFAEKRRLILPIAVAAIVNLVVYAVVIYPRTSSAGALELRAQQAAMARARAAADLRDAEAIRTGQERAAQQLARFYDSVLPKGQEGARRITYRRLATLADESNLDYDRRTIATKQDHESALEQHGRHDGARRRVP